MKKTIRIFSYLPSDALLKVRDAAARIPDADLTEGDEILRLTLTRPEGAQDRATARDALCALVQDQEMSENQIARLDASGEPELTIIFAPLETKPEFVIDSKVSAHAEIEAFFS